MRHVVTNGINDIFWPAQPPPLGNYGTTGVYYDYYY